MVKLSEEELQLIDCKGIGPKTVEKLKERGIESLEQLAVMSPKELASELGITSKAAKDIIMDAKNKALDKAIKLFTFKDVDEHIKTNVKKISTSSISLDSLLNGGVKTESITCLFGPFATGKTQLAKQLSVNCLKNLKRKVAWIETEPGTFLPDRLKEIAEGSGYKIDMDNDFVIVPAKFIGTPSHQFLALEMVEKRIKEGMDVGLIVVDSFSAKFRQYTGREMLPDRSQEQGRHLGYLDSLAAKYNLAIVLTIQAMDTPDAGGQLYNIMKYGTRKQPVGGNILLHSGTYLISLDKVKGDEWEACVFDAPDLPMSKERFRITKSGIRDVSTRSKTL